MHSSNSAQNESTHSHHLLKTIHSSGLDTTQIMQRVLFRRGILWTDPVVERIALHITSAAKAAADAASTTTVELEVRFGILGVDRRGRQRIAFPAASPTIMKDKRTTGYFVPGSNVEIVNNIEGRLTKLVRQRPLESRQLLIHTACEKRFIYNVLEEDGQRLLVKPTQAINKRRMEYSDIYLPQSLSDIRIALASETVLPTMGDADRKMLVPLTGRLRSRKSLTVDSLLRVDISHVELSQGLLLEREWRRDLTKRCELYLPRRSSEVNIEIELLPSALRRVRRQELRAEECARHILGVARYLAD